MQVIVGPSKEVFYVYASLFRKPDNFFDLALQQCWREGQEGKVPLPEDDPYIFRLYAAWVYEGKIFCKSNTTTTARDYDTLIGLYIFGEKVLDRDFQDRVIDALLAKYEEVNTLDTKHRIPDRSQITRIYKYTPTASPLRLLVVDWCVRDAIEVDTELRASMEEEANREYVADLLAASFERRTLTEQAKTDLKNRQAPGCAYHHCGNDKLDGSQGPEDGEASDNDGSIPEDSSDWGRLSKSQKFKKKKTYGW